MPFCYLSILIDTFDTFTAILTSLRWLRSFSPTFGPVILWMTPQVTEGCWEIRTTLFVRIVFFYWKTNWDCLVWGGVSLTGPDIGKSWYAPKRLQRFWWNFDGIGSRASSNLWDGWLPPENLVEKNIGKKLFPHVKPMGNLGYFQKWFSQNPL